MMTEINGLAVGFICYEPDPDRLIMAVNALKAQAAHIYIVDNASSNEEVFSRLLSQDPVADKISWIRNEENLGVAAPLDDLLSRASNDGYQWLLSMDQDSVFEEGALKILHQTGEEYHAALVCPLAADPRRKNEPPAKKEDLISEVPFCITSGSLMNIEKIQKAGGIDRFLFIDLIDTELCYRLILNGEKILCDHKVLLNHELGKITPSPFEKEALYLFHKTGISVFGKLSYKREVFPERVYYVTRNALYLESKYNAHPLPEFSSSWAFKNGISSVLRGKKKIKIWKNFRRGWKDGKAIQKEWKDKNDN